MLSNGTMVMHNVTSLGVLATPIPLADQWSDDANNSLVLGAINNATVMHQVIIII